MTRRQDFLVQNFYSDDAKHLHVALSSICSAADNPIQAIWLLVAVRLDRRIGARHRLLRCLAIRMAAATMTTTPKTTAPPSAIIKSIVPCES